MRFYLYGKGEREVWSLLREPGFRQVVREMPRGDAAPELVDRCVACGLLEREGAGLRPGARLVLVPAEPEQELKVLLHPLLDRYTEIAADSISTLRRAFASTATARDFSWEQVCHAVGAGMFLDLAVGGELFHTGTILRKPWETLVWGFAHVSAANSFGVQWLAAPGRRCGFAQMWHRAVPRSDLALSGSQVGVLARIGSGDGEGSAASDLLYLRFLQLIRREEAAWRLRVPSFDAVSFAKLLPPLQSGAARLVSQVVVPALKRAATLPWWATAAREDAGRHAIVRLVLEYGADAVVAAGHLEPFPQGNEIPACWGRWIWHESTSMPSLVTGSFDAEPAFQA